MCVIKAETLYFRARPHKQESLRAEMERYPYNNTPRKANQQSFLYGPLCMSRGGFPITHKNFRIPQYLFVLFVTIALYF